MDVYGYHNGVKFRVQCDKYPTLETINAIKHLVEAASKFNPDNNGKGKTTTQSGHQPGFE